MRVTPRGVVAALFAFAVAALCVRLGFWQLRRLEERREANAVIAAARSLPPLALSGAGLDTVILQSAAVVHRRARVAGAYAPAGEVVLRGRSRNGRPGVHLVTPLEVSGSGYSLLVDRGWIPSADASTVDPAPFAQRGEMVVEGVLRPLPATATAVPSRRRVDGAEVLTLQRLEGRLMRSRTSRPLLPVYLERTAGPALPSAPPYPGELEPLDEGPHLSYAVQWFGFAAIAVIGFLVTAYRASRPPDS